MVAIMEPVSEVKEDQEELTTSAQLKVGEKKEWEIDDSAPWCFLLLSHLPLRLHTGCYNSNSLCLFIKYINMKMMVY